MSKLAEFLVPEGVVDDISHEGLRLLLREEGVSDQVIKTWKYSSDPCFEAKKNRILHLYGLMDGTDHSSHHEQASMIRRYIAWRNRNAHDRRFREIGHRAKVA